VVGAIDGHDCPQVDLVALAEDAPRLLRPGRWRLALTGATSRGSVSYSEVYLDVIANAMRSRSWFRQGRPAA